MESVINIMRMYLKKVESHECKYQGAAKGWISSRYLDVTESRCFMDCEIEESAVNEQLELQSGEQRESPVNKRSPYVFRTHFHQ